MANVDDTKAASRRRDRFEDLTRRAWARTAAGPMVTAVLVAVSLSIPVPILADWLVLESGDQVETRGPWRVEGRRVIFTSTRGVLSSARLAMVDVEASRDLTKKKAEEAAKAEEKVEVEERREPVLVLTDADVGPARVAPAAAAAGEEGEAGLAATEPVVVPSSDPLENRIARQLPGSPSIQVLDWSIRPTGEDETSVLGYVQNTSEQVATAVSVTVTLRDSEGVVIETSQAELSSNALMPGTQAFYEATFVDGFNFSEVEFDLSSVDLEVAPEQLAAGQEAEAGTAAPEAPFTEEP